MLFMNSNQHHIGIDIGSVSVNVAVLSHASNSRFGESMNRSTQFWSFDLGAALPSTRLYLSEYFRHQGDYVSYIRQLLDNLTKNSDTGFLPTIAITGGGGRRYAEENGLYYVNGFRAIAEGISRCYRDVRTIFEMGGESSNYLRIHRNGDAWIQIVDYETNGDCAAGTGSFIDQQVERLRYQIEDVGELIVSTEKAANIAGRCSVFAKSDMIHAQQRGYSPPQILKGLCESVVRNYKGCITKGKPVESKVALTGGVAANAGMIEAFKTVFDLREGDLIVPEPYAWMGAIGAAMIGKQSTETAAAAILVKDSETPISFPTARPLSMDRVRHLQKDINRVQTKTDEAGPTWLGIDIGSVSTNLALIDSNGQLIHGIYRMTEGRPIEIVTDALKEMQAAVPDISQVNGVGTTGSGRELIGLLVGADIVKDEITCHKTGADFIARQCLQKPVDTIFEIGGQDSKFISMKEGVVVDFSLNEACAAGTGSFLEEQANKLGISIRDEFSSLALSSKQPLQIGERCTVFMEKEAVPYLHQGVAKSDIVAGLSYSVVQNYLNRVVKKRPIGDVIFFQGGTAFNDAVAAAFATTLDKEIVVPPHNGIMGAIGAALLCSRKQNKDDKSQFKGWDLSAVDWNLKEFNCNACSNQCAIQQFEIDGEKSYWGDKCSDRYRKRSKSDKKAGIPDLFKLRESLFIPDSEPKDNQTTETRRIGMPLSLFYYERLPFWRTYFKTLGFEPVLSAKTNPQTVKSGVELAKAEPCFPLQVLHGHVMELQNKGVDFLAIPNIVNEEDPTQSVASFICPWAQTAPLVLLQSDAIPDPDKLFYPNIEFVKGQDYVRRQLVSQMKALDVPASAHEEAVSAGYAAYAQFRTQFRLGSDTVVRDIVHRQLPTILLIGRPYNLYDPGINLNIPGKLRDLYGMNVLPMDAVPYENIDIQDIHDHMFWNYGRRILQSARWKKEFPFVHIIYLSNFKCGPDSYIRHFVEDAAGSPLLFLQLDSHSNDAGIMTRIEAFLESKGLL